MLINETCYAMAFDSENPQDIPSKSSRVQGFLRNHIMATVTINVQFCSKLRILETLESIKFTTPKNIP